MIDLMLRFADEPAAIAALPQYRATDEDGTEHWQTDGSGYALLPIGALTLQHAEIDEQGEQLSPAVIAEGYHVNLRLAEPDEQLAEALAAWMIEPANPRFEWA